MTHSVLHLIHRAGQLATDAFDQGGCGTTSRQHLVLAALVDRDKVTQTELVEATGIDRSTMADIVRRLLKRGYVSRKRGTEDARCQEVKITDAGRAALRRASAAAEAADRALLEKVPGKLREPFVKALKAVAHGEAAA